MPQNHRPRDLESKLLLDILESAPVDVVALDKDLRFEYINPRAIEDEPLRRWAVGRTEDELAEKRGGSQSHQRLRAYEHAQATGERAHFEESWVDRAGHQHHTLRLLVPKLDTDGKLQRIFGYGLEITDRVQAQEQLRQAQKMEAIGRLAGGIAHDFNNVLTALQGYCDLITSESTEKDVLDYAKEMEVATGRAAELTSKLLSLSRRQGFDEKVVSINRRVREAENLLRRVIGEDVDLRVELDPAAGRVRLDAGELDQALLNLVVNARDAMPSGGTLTLRTRAVNVIGEPQAELRIVDTGIGMDEHVQDRIFEPFFTTKDSARGTGLGLAMVYATVMRQGGRIDVESSPGRGTAMILRWPRVGEAETVDEVKPKRVSTGGAETLLLVEDDAAVRQLLEQQLQRLGYRILVADSGSSALELLRGHDGELEMLISDVVMPGMSGPELARQLLDRHPDLPVLFISGYAAAFLEQHGFHHDEHEVLLKPFTSRTLVDKVRSVLDRAN